MQSAEKKCGMLFYFFLDPYFPHSHRVYAKLLNEKCSYIDLFAERARL